MLASALIGRSSIVGGVAAGVGSGPVAGAVDAAGAVASDDTGRAGSATAASGAVDARRVNGRDRPRVEGGRAVGAAQRAGRTISSENVSTSWFGAGKRSHVPAFQA